MRTPRPRRRLAALALLSIPLAALALAQSTIPWTELTEADELFSISVRTARLGDAVVYYPAPTRELAEALEARAAREDAAGLDARRHLAEARRQLGDLPGALKAIEEWADGRGTAPAFSEAARWAARHLAYPLAFRAAGKALAVVGPGGLPEKDRKALASERIAWIDAAPEEERRALPDALSLEEARVRLFPRERAFLESYLARLEKAGRLAEAEEALRTSPAYDDASRLAGLAALKARHGQPDAVFTLLKDHLERTLAPPPSDLATRFAQAADLRGREALATWRARLEARFDAPSLSLLAAYFTGKERADQASDLLAQVERRHEAGTDAGGLDRKAWLLLASWHERLDEVPAAFRARIAAARTGTQAERLDDLAALAALSLRAGSRPLPWGIYNDEPYRWAARVDVTPGFTTGGLSFLLTGFPREAALATLEERRLPERTFQTARLLASELERRAPAHPELPALRVRLMRRHVERGEGAEALALLPAADANGSAPEAVRAEARRVALLAVRQARTPIERELELWKERLALLAADGSVPEMASGREADGEALVEIPAASYGPAVREAVSRLSARDKSNRTSLTLLLHEMDRLPGAEALWSFAADRISGWNLTDGVEERYRVALASFEGAGWWNRLTRWYARQKRQAELAELAQDVVARFRGSEIFARDPRVDAVVPAEGQPNPYIAFGHYLRLKALERFPASPTVVREAESALMRRSDWDALPKARKDKSPAQGVADDTLFASRRVAVVFSDAARRSALLDRVMKEGKLAQTLDELKAVTPANPVAARILLDGLARLSRYEEAVAWADRLAQDYPGDASVTAEALSLHRSLSGLSPSHAGRAAALADQAERCLDDPADVFTQLGETWQALDRPAEAAEAWRRITARRPGDAAAALEEATLLWDYGRPQEGLDVITAARKRLDRPRLHAFEAGVLREEVRDLPGALEEYVAAIRGEVDWEGGTEGWEAGEYRAQQRLATLVGRPRVRELLLQKVQRLQPGLRADEESFVTLLTLASLYPEGSDAFDDWMDVAPADTVGAERKREAREAARPDERQGLAILSRALLGKAREMVARATRPELLEKVRAQLPSLTRSAPAGAPEAPATSAPSLTPAVELESAILAREAELAEGEEARIAKEMARARFLLSHRRVADARSLVARILPRTEALPDGAPRIRALVDWARFEESAESAEAARPDGSGAASAWARVAAAYPWSLGVLEDRLAYLDRNGRTREQLDVLMKAAASAATGHRERLLSRLASASLAAGEVSTARRAATDLLAEPLADDRRVSALFLLARVSYRAESAFDGMALARQEAARVPSSLTADVFAAVARAAREEGKPAAAVDLYIESLNRRLDTATLKDAARTAAAAGRAEALLKFFETQQRRSPRDVRWAVAVRDVRAFAGDLEGAIAAAREAVEVAPERKELHEETVALYQRAGRPAEAADFLSRWAASRPSDESTADWRSGLYVAAGELEKALAVERDAILAFTRDASGTLPADQLKSETLERTARAVRRFLWKRRAEIAWKLAAPEGRVARARELPLSATDLTSIALRSGNLNRLLRAVESDAELLSEAAGTIQANARPEQLAELQEWLLGRIFPPGTTSPSTQANAGLNRFWDFARDAGLHRFEEAVARRLLASRVERPWGESPPIAFLTSLTPVVEHATVPRYALSEDDFLGEWARFLDARDRSAELSPLVARHLERIDVAVRGTAPVSTADDFPGVFPASSLGRLLAAKGHESERRLVAGWLGTPEAWRRFQEVTGVRWGAKDLLPLVDEGTRRAFFRHTSLAGKDAEPIYGVSAAVTALLEGRPGAAASPEIARLRGARTVGEVVERDPRFLWPQLGNVAVPKALWGLRAGEAWFVLESLASYRQKEAGAPWIPLESTTKASALSRALVAERLAEGIGARPLALDLSERYLVELSQGDHLARRLRLLSSSGARAKAEELLAAEVRRRQERLDADALLDLRSLARELSLSDPVKLLDPKASVAPSLVAAILDWSGPAAAASLRAKDPVEARAAISTRLGARLDHLSTDETRYWLDEVWVTGGAFPSKAAARLGPAWETAGPVLVNLDTRLRETALAALRALPDAGPLQRFAADLAGDTPEVELLRLFADVRAPGGAGGGAPPQNIAALRRLARLLSSGTAYADWKPVVPGEGEEYDAEGSVLPGPASFARLEGPSGLLATSRASAAWGLLGSAPPELREAARRALREHAGKEIERGPAPAAVWSLALSVAASPEDVTGLLAELERAWARGELPVYELEPIVARLATMEGGPSARTAEAAARFAARLPEVAGTPDLERRVRLLAALSRPAEARREIERARPRIVGRVSDRRLFEIWRALPAAPGTVVPGYWSRAAELWAKEPEDLEAKADALLSHLSKLPYDEAAASILFASLSPAREEVVEAARRAAGSAGDQLWLLRAARLERARSPRAARGLLRDAVPQAEDLEARGFGAREVSAALADTVRILAANGERTDLATLVRQLEERRAPELAPLTSEIPKLLATSAERPETVRVENGRLRPLLPSDLTWDLLARVLTAEDVP